MYLDPLDHFVEETLGSRRYLRYMDDFCLSSESKAELAAWRRAVEGKLGGLRLKPKPGKNRVYRTDEEVTFPGFRVFPTHPREYPVRWFGQRICERGALAPTVRRRYDRLVAVDLSRIAARLRERNAEEARQIERRRVEALAEVERLRREFLRIDPAIRRIVLFGSLAENRVTRMDFDIDLAVSSDRYLALVSASLDSPFRVDCVDLDALPASFREGIERYGRVTYGKE